MHDDAVLELSVIVFDALQVVQIVDHHSSGLLIFVEIALLTAGPAAADEKTRSSADPVATVRQVLRKDKLTRPAVRVQGRRACGKPVDRSWTTFLQRTIRMILFAFFPGNSVEKNFCHSPLPTYNE